MKFTSAAAALVAIASIADVSAFMLSKSATMTIHRTSLAAHIYTSEDSPRNIEGFEEWCTQYGVQKMDGLQLYTEDGLDYELITTQDLPAGSVIMYVPAEVVLSSNQIAQELESLSDGSVAEAVKKLGKIGGAGSTPKFFLFLKREIVFDCIVYTCQQLL